MQLFLHDLSAMWAYLYSLARLFLIKRMDDTKYMPIISERKRTTLEDVPLPTLETAKKNCIQITAWREYKKSRDLRTFNKSFLKLTSRCYIKFNHA